MSEPAPQPMSVAAFFAWQERQAERYEFVSGMPVRMMAGDRNAHDDIVGNLLAALHTALRGSGWRHFTGDGSVETLPDRIGRPDVGVDCGRRDPSGLKAAEPRLVAEVLSSGTRDFDAFEKLGDYKTLDPLGHILLIEPNAVDVMLRSRDAGRAWVRTRIVGLDASAALPALGITLRLADPYDGVALPARPRLVPDETPGGAAG